MHYLHHAGHYIVVVAYCASSDSYEVRDPAAEAGHLTVPAAVLEAARRSFGTDEDIILVRTLPILRPLKRR
jgi:Guanylylate cyclase